MSLILFVDTDHEVTKQRTCYPVSYYLNATIDMGHMSFKMAGMTGMVTVTRAEMLSVQTTSSCH